MSERVIEAEVAKERIVACPQCGRRNRLYKRTATGVYKCGACRAALANPFATHAIRISSMRNAGIIGASIFALLVIIVIVASNHATLRTPIQAAASPPPEIPTEVPRSGILFDAYPDRTAKGKFTVINGSSSHAIVKVIDITSDRKILSFAIHAGKRITITAIPDGTYNVIFTFGDRVYLGTDRFEKPRGSQKYDRPFEFTTRTTATETEEATLYRMSATELTVTLTSVIGGNITTSSISQQEFERY